MNCNTLVFVNATGVLSAPGIQTGSQPDTHFEGSIEVIRVSSLGSVSKCDRDVLMRCACNIAQYAHPYESRQGGSAICSTRWSNFRVVIGHGVFIFCLVRSRSMVVRWMTHKIYCNKYIAAMSKSQHFLCQNCRTSICVAGTAKIPLKYRSKQVCRSHCRRWAVLDYGSEFLEQEEVSQRGYARARTTAI